MFACKDLGCRACKAEMWKRREGPQRSRSSISMSFLCCCGRIKASREYSENQRCTEMVRIEVTAGQHLGKVVAWSQSFKMMLRSPEGRDVFLAFLRSVYSEENFMFCIACEELKKETNPSVIAEKARIIYRDYISIFSPKMINLNNWVREDIMQNLNKPSCMIFEEARLQIYYFMHRYFFPRFLKSSVYRDFLNCEKCNVSATI